MTRVYTLLGEYDLALDQIDRLLTIPSFLTPAWVEMDPSWARLRDHPRYLGILDRHRTTGSGDDRSN